MMMMMNTTTTCSCLSNLTCRYHRPWRNLLTKVFDIFRKEKESERKRKSGYIDINKETCHHYLEPYKCIFMCENGHDSETLSIWILCWIFSSWSRTRRSRRRKKIGEMIGSVILHWNFCRRIIFLLYLLYIFLLLVFAYSLFRYDFMFSTTDLRP